MIEDFVAYRVGDDYFNNIYLALHHSWRTAHPVALYCYDATYDQLDWQHEPDQTLEDLMLAHALDLRSRYERLILLWSGGTDSHTIYNVFATHRIRIDEILIKASPYLEQYPESHVDWMRHNHWDPTTIITRYDQNDSVLRGIDCADEEWVWKPTGDLLIFGMSTGANGVKHLIERHHAGHSWTAIAGFEKPRLVYRQGRWWARQLDVPLRQTMGYGHLTRFFLEPSIHLKQNHILRRAVIKHIADSGLPLYDGDWAEAKYPQTQAGYHAWASACGRHSEVTLGASHLQKIRTADYWAMDISKAQDIHRIDSIGDPLLNAHLQQGDCTAVNFIKGLFNLRAESQFVRWLNESRQLREPNQLLNPEFIWSKEYDLGSIS